MSGIHAAIERNRRAYEQLIGGQVMADNERLGLPEAPSLASAWAAQGEQVRWAGAAPADTGQADLAGASGDAHPQMAQAAGFSLSPAPPDPLEMAELWGRAAEHEERLTGQNLEREER